MKNWRYLEHVERKNEDSFLLLSDLMIISQKKKRRIYYSNLFFCYSRRLHRRSKSVSFIFIQLFEQSDLVTIDFFIIFFILTTIQCFLNIHSNSTEQPLANKNKEKSFSNVLVIQILLFDLFTHTRTHAHGRLIS